jgi:hypothetical protein
MEIWTSVLHDAIVLVTHLYTLGMPSEPPSESGLQIVWPTAQEVQNGLARIEKYLPVWKQGPGLYVNKPSFGRHSCAIWFFASFRK